VFGTVVSVGVNSFVVTTHSGSKFIVNVTKETTYRDHDVTSPSFANIKVGEMVAVFGPETSGPVTAISVGIGTPGGRGGHSGRGAFGVVATVGTNSFTITTHNGSTVTVDVTNATTYRDHRVTPPSFASIKVGEMVVAFGAETAGKVTATSVGIGIPGCR
jgi:ABC-type lipopolysaccharide export system ATPase subunit